MTAIASAQTAEDLTARTFEIALRCSAFGDVTVLSCDITGRHFRNSTSFGRGARLEKVFCGRVCHALQTRLRRLDRADDTISEAAFLLELPGLILGDLHLTAQPAQGRGTDVTVRFGTFIGGINRMFREDIGFDDPLAEATSELAVRVIGEVAVPLLDLCAAAEQDLAGIGGPFGAFGRRVGERGHEIRFQAELLKRFVGSRNKTTGPVVDTGHLKAVLTGT